MMLGARCAWALALLAGCAGGGTKGEPPAPDPAAPSPERPRTAPPAKEAPTDVDAALEATRAAAQGQASTPAAEPAPARPPEGPSPAVLDPGPPPGRSAPAPVTTPDKAPGTSPGTSPRTPPGTPLDPGAPAASAAVPGPSSAASPAEQVKAIVGRLKSRDRKVAEEALRELWEVEARLIPALVLEVENPEPSALSELKILVADKEGFARLRNLGTGPCSEYIVLEEPGVGKLVHDIAGMGAFEYEELSSGPAQHGRSLRVVVRRSTLSLAEGPRRFPVGVVIRSALINRFRTAEQPRFDHRRDILRWWQALYELRKDKL